MKPDPQFVRQLRAAVWRRVAASPALRRDRRKPPGFLRRQRGWSVLRWGVPLIFLFAAAFGTPANLVLGYAVLWTFTVLAFRATKLVSHLGSADLLWPYYMLPVSDTAVFQRQRTVWIRESLGGVLDWLAIGLGLAIHDPSLPRWLLVLPLAFAQGAVLTALAAWAVRLWPRFPYVLLILVDGVLIFVCLKFFESGLRYSFIEPFLRFLTVVTPAGWLVRAYQAAADLQMLGWLGLISLGAISALLVAPALAVMQRRFRMDPLFGYESDSAPASFPGTGQDPDQEEVRRDEPPLQREPVTLAPRELQQLRDRLAGHLSADPARVLAQGPIESVILRCLSRRDRVLIESLQLSPFGSWRSSWGITLGLLVVAHLLALAGLEPQWPGLLSAGALGLFIFPIFGGNWEGFRPTPLAQYEVGMHSYLPIGFWETARVMFKVNSLRTIAGLPLLLLAIRYGWSAQPLGWVQTFDLAWRILLLLVALLPFWTIARFSYTSNDTSSRWWSALVAIGVMLTGLVCLVVGCIVMLALPERLPALGIGLLIMAYFAVLLAGYGFAYRAGVFDLMSRPRTD